MSEEIILRKQRIAAWKYHWKCPKPGCDKKLWGIIRETVLTNARRHLDWHDRIQA